MTDRKEIWNKAEKRLYELYGDYPDLRIVVNHFLSERMALAHFGVAEYFDEIAGICRESLEKYNEKLIAKNTVSCCFTAYLLGASDINPLPMHYYCKCKRVEWLDDLDNDKCLFDMRHTRTCECGAEMKIDGYDIPCETYLPYVQRLNVKDSPKTYKDLLDVLTKKHFQFSLLGAGQICHLLGQATGISPDDIDLNDCEVKNKLLSGDFSCASPKLAEFLKQAYTVVQPSNYNELIKLIGVVHGTGTWKHNVEELLMNGKCRLADIPSTRDEVFMKIRNSMEERGVYDNGFAYDVAEKARKGYYAEHGMDNYTVEMLYELRYDDWFIDYLLRTNYMSTKALSVMELKYFILLTWYKTYYPKQYAEVIGDENIWEGGENNG